MSAPGTSIDSAHPSVEFVPDGEVQARPTELFPGTTPADWREYPGLLDATGRLLCAVGTFLIRTREHTMLVDLGLGPMSANTAGGRSYRGGRLLDNLAALGIAPDAVDTVVFTHLHRDHVGWTSTATSAGHQLTFANARHLVHPAEWNHWVSTPSPLGPDPETVLDVLRDRVEFCTDGVEIADCLQVIETPGHTPGHISLGIEVAGGRRTVIAGDVLHSPAQLLNPQWSFGSDHDPLQAAASRAKLLDTFGAETLACGHFPGGLVPQQARLGR